MQDNIQFTNIRIYMHSEVGRIVAKEDQCRALPPFLVIQVNSG